MSNDLSHCCLLVMRSFNISVLQLVQCLSLCGPSALTESVYQFVNQHPNIPTTSADKSATTAPGDWKNHHRTGDVNANTVRHAETMGNIAAAANKSSSEWQRILMSEQVSDKPCCSAIIDLKQCDKRHQFESSVLGSTIKVNII